MQTANNGAHEFLQLRIWIAEQDWLQVLLSDIADIAGQAVGSTEKDSFVALKAVMRRKGFILDR